VWWINDLLKPTLWLQLTVYSFLLMIIWNCKLYAVKTFVCHRNLVLSFTSNQVVFLHELQLSQPIFWLKLLVVWDVMTLVFLLFLLRFVFHITEKLTVQLQIEDITRKLKSGDLGIPPNPEDRFDVASTNLLADWRFSSCGFRRLVLSFIQFYQLECNSIGAKYSSISCLCISFNSHVLVSYNSSTHALLL